MRILITNDDGINSPCLPALIEWASRLGTVTVSAPRTEQSGKSHSIEIKKPFETKKVRLFPGYDALAVDSTPADCVRYAVMGLGREFDLVISGINRGFNLGEDIAYSGTAGAAFEASYLGINALALSTHSSTFQTALSQLDRVYAFIEENSLYSHNGIFNVNIPLTVKGIRITRQGGVYYSDRFTFDGDFVQPNGYLAHRDTKNLTLDTDAVMNGYISVTPLTASRTAESAFRKLSYLNEDKVTS